MKAFNLVAYLIFLLLNIILQVRTIDFWAANNPSNFDFDNVLSKFKVPFEVDADDSLTETENNYHEDIHLTSPQLIKKYGYLVQEHEVKTSDGYLLTMFRIPKKAPAVLVINGGTISSDEYLTIGSQAGLAYQLADAGFDVWLANCRGNKYSLGHVKLPTSSEEYWDFTFDEMGRYDMPALIDYILDATDAKDLKLIGYSQGTTVNLVLCSEKPEYNDKISMMILISPTVYFTHLKLDTLKLLSGPLTPNFYLLAKSFGIYSAFSDRDIGPTVSKLTNIFCATPETAEIYCYTLMSIVFGSNRNQINATSLPVIFGHFPTSSSIKMFQHYTQLAISQEFRRYDYGKDSNLVKYGTSDPPKYCLDEVKTKVAVFWAKKDRVCPEEDLQILLAKLPNVVDVYMVPDDDFTHTDFVFAKDVKTLVYDKVIEQLKSN